MTRRSETLIPKLMHLSRVQAKAQFKSESLKLRKNTIKRNARKMVCNMLFVRQQTPDAGWDLESMDST